MVTFTFAALALTATHAAAPDLAVPEAAESMAKSAQAFVASLSADLRKKALFEFSDAERHNWHYFPKKNRKGLAQVELNEAQKKALDTLMQSTLSAAGRTQVTNVVTLEGILGKRAGMYDAGLYYVTLFGEPGAGKPWGWRYEGHHLSLNFTVVKDQFISATPSFFGANPAQVREGPHQGLRALRGEEEFARAFLLSLDEKQRAAAIVDSRSYAQLASGASPQATVLPSIGLAAQQLSGKQRDALMQLLTEYANVLRPELAQHRMDRIRAAGVENIRFAWTGGVKPGEAHYYRIQGPTFLIEYDNSQNDANHIHSVWRDFNGDFGRDLLKEHQAREHGRAMIASSASR